MVKIQKTNTNLVGLINRLRQEKRPFWKKVAEMLSRPRSRMITLNISKLEKLGNEGSTILVPGKVLGDGRISKKFKVAALNFSGSAKKQITSTGGKAVSILELVDSGEEPKNIILLS
ncbi:MAG: 50S ribosomal protein L18e [Candidatus ainarchaeum sp.]|nr:50S ribosomal protein L18e [Candidatus ainarchaeum sp.]